MEHLKYILNELFKLNFDYVLNAISWRLPNWVFIYVRHVIVVTDNPKIITRKLTSYDQNFATIEDAYLLEKVNIKTSILRNA